MGYYLVFIEMSWAHGLFSRYCLSCIFPYHVGKTCPFRTLLRVFPCSRTLYLSLISWDMHSLFDKGMFPKISPPLGRFAADKAALHQSLMSRQYGLSRKPPPLDPSRTFQKIPLIMFRCLAPQYSHSMQAHGTLSWYLRSQNTRSGRQSRAPFCGARLIPHTIRTCTYV